MRRFIFLAAIFFAIPLAAAAQSTSKVELFGGYTYTRIYNTDGDTGGSNGFTGDVGFFPLKWAGVVADVGYGFSNGYVLSDGTSVFAPTHSIHYFAGPRIRWGFGRVTPYAQALFGAVHRDQLQAPEDLIAPAQTNFAFKIGGGVDLKVARHFSLRLIEVSYLGTSFTSVSSVRTNDNDISLATGFVIH